jgi:hypothetical protein
MRAQLSNMPNHVYDLCALTSIQGVELEECITGTLG